MNFNKRHNKASSRIYKRNKIKKFIYIILLASIPLIILASFFFILRADFLQIGEINILGQKEIPREELEQLIWLHLNEKRFLFIPQNNILFYNQNELKNILLKNFGRIESLNLRSGLNRTLHIEIKERVAEYVWCDEFSSCYLMDRNSLIFERANDLNSHGRIVFGGINIEEPLMKYLMERETMQKYSNVIDVLKENMSLYSVNFVDLNKVIFVTNNGDIYFNPEEDMTRQATNTILLINEMKNKNENISFEYIDPRFGNKIYYKTKN